MYIAVNGGEVIAEASSVNALREAVLALGPDRTAGEHFDVYQKVDKSFKVEHRLVCVESLD